jgi:mono/diheme cytochrome c family protein
MRALYLQGWVQKMDKYMLLRNMKSRLSAALVAALCVSSVVFATDLPSQPPPTETVVKGRVFIAENGATLFHVICQGCHMPDAKGAEGAGHYPALAKDSALASAVYPALTVLKGRNAMPAFGASLSDAQIAAVVNYVRTHFGNHYSDSLTAADVAKFR